MKTFKFRSETVIEAEDEEKAKDEFADNSSDFAANAECFEVPPQNLVPVKSKEEKDRKFAIGLERREKGWVEVIAKNDLEAVEKGYEKYDDGQVNWGKEETEFFDPEEVEKFEHEIEPDLPDLDKNEKSLFCKIVDFMESESFKHTDQTVDGQDIFERGKDKVIIEIIEKGGDTE